ncbi:MAG: 4-hydroxy-tetrahydrodipicolinate reductase [Deltaproteobacteria bacterium]|jgi:4-hydroxy-tetrahydrodipicolinate reductase|nr:4-hydroxy-tetrahydrodipicolinate reductase [Deltaproteobacteria bacterium]
MTPLPVAVAGVLGRMGRRLVAGILDREDLTLVGGTIRAGAEGEGQDLGSLTGGKPLGVYATSVLAEALKEAKVLVDFTSPAAVVNHLKTARAKKVPMVIGVTGLGEPEIAAINEAANDIAVLWAPNMSLGVNLLYKLVDLAARSLGPDFDLEVVEAHHRLKKDAPSGTAAKIAQILATARELPLETIAYGRSGIIGPRPNKEIGVLALRGGDIVGEHTVYFCGLGERLELTHRAQSRDTFVAGALRAASWLADKPAGLYSINHVLGFN